MYNIKKEKNIYETLYNIRFRKLEMIYNEELEIF